MTLLIALLSSILAGIISLSILRAIFMRKRHLASRLHRYTEENKRPDSVVRPRPKGSQNVWQVVGKFAPKAISQRYTPILQQAGIPLKGEEMAGIIGAATILGALLGGMILSIPGWVLGGIAGYKFPGIMLNSYLKRRLIKAEDQLVDFLSLTANALRAGHSFLQGLDLAGREMADPIGGELRRTLREVNLGISVDEALHHLCERLPSADLDLVVTAVLIQRQVGGDLAGVLDNIAATIRERQHMKAQVKTLTAQGRLSGLVITGLPFVLLLVLNAMNPEYVSLLWKEPIGLVLLGIGLMGQVLGTVFINKIIKIEI